jgi:hypothetical protein
MRTDPIQDDYKATVGTMQNLREHAGVVRGDPAKAARAILQIASEPQPPLRLLLGTDAVFLGEAATRARAEEDARWKPLGMSTDFDGVGDFAETPFARMLVEKRS